MADRCEKDVPVGRVRDVGESERKRASLPKREGVHVARLSVAQVVQHHGAVEHRTVSHQDVPVEHGFGECLPGDEGRSRGQGQTAQDAGEETSAVALRA